jgi:hypothetical protein
MIAEIHERGVRDGAACAGVSQLATKRAGTRAEGDFDERSAVAQGAAAAVHYRDIA